MYYVQYTTDTEEALEEPPYLDSILSQSTVLCSTVHVLHITVEEDPDNVDRLLLFIEGQWTVYPITPVVGRDSQENLHYF